MMFFGLGTDTAESSRTNYRLVDTGLWVGASYRLLPWLAAGVELEGVAIDVGPGTNDDVPATGDVFDEESAPGIETQPDYLASSFFAAVDYRDVPRNARAGGFYRFAYTHNRDLESKGYSFDRVDAKVTQLFPFFDKRRVLVLHGQLAYAYAADGNRVPFYLMPYLGGDDTARGYYQYRFHDRSLAVFNAEYRFESFAGLDVALFYDAGKVAPELSDITMSDLKTSYGIGFRFSTKNRFVFRVDVGAGGGEGTHVFIKFDHAF
jgi:outer membrane protein assembly factor BamA